MQNIILNIFFLLLMSLIPTAIQAQYTMPIEIQEHEGTWLQWPHNHLYGPYYRDDLKTTFVEMTRELVKGENVHIIAYDNSERTYITQTLTNAGVSLDKVDFVIRPTNDVWVRDNGPIFVYNQNHELAILDWGFNGWGGDTPYQLCNTIPEAIATTLGLPRVNLNHVVLEGGAFEIDGNGTFLATKSSILNSDRNPNLTQAAVESYLSTYLGVTNFIWLNGVAGLEITDMHIDGFARFHDAQTIVTMNSADLTYWEVPSADITTLLNATNINGTPYNYIYLPLTQNNVRTTWNENLGYKGSYVNYYIANEVVLVPSYNDPKDAVAQAILQNIYPDKEVVGIDVRNLYASGGMIHCVTQQQPLVSSVLPVKMTYFEAENTGCQVVLNWASRSEINHDKFIIERSDDDKNFVPIGQVNVQGSMSAENQYRFMDEAPLAVNYYRLRQVDLDGKSTFSAVITARKNCTSDMTMALFPNVTKTSALLQIHGGVNDVVDIQLLSAQGKVMQTSTETHRNKLGQIVLNVRAFPAGMYYVQVTALKNKFMEVVPLVVVR